MKDNKLEKKNENIEGETKVSPLSLHNIYKNINISIKTLDYIIVGLILTLVIVLIIAFSNRGFTIEFDCQGGTNIEPIKRMYGETIGDVYTSRQGYKFDFWALDQGCTNKWDNNKEITDSIKLYACWIND